MSNLQRIGLIAVFGLAATIFGLGVAARWGQPDPIDAPAKSAALTDELARDEEVSARTEAPDGRRWLSGRVRQAGGAAASGADVVVIDSDLRAAAALEAAAEGQSKGVLARATADDDGAFRVALEPDVDRVQLVARASLAYAPAPLVVERRGEEWESCVVELELGADLVIVSGPPGPLTVRADASEGSVQPRGTPVGSRDFAIEPGAELVVAGLRPGVPLEVVATPSDAAPVRLRLAALEPGETRNVVLSNQPGEVFAGRVVDSRRQGVEGARIVLTWPVEPGRRGDEVTSGSTGADGRFELQRVPSAELAGQVRAEGFAPLEFWVPASGPGRSAGGFELELGAGVRLSGRVQGPEGRPAAGADVEVVAERGESERSGTPEARLATADADGRFEVTGLEGRRFKVVARLARDDEAELRAVARSIEPGVEVALTLLPTVALEVLARGPGGEAVPEIELVGALMDRRTSVQDPGQVFDMSGSDAGGLHRVTGLLPGTWQVSLSARGLGPIDELSVELPREGPLVVDFEAAATVSGRVTAPDGTPLAGGRVLAWTTRPLGFAVRVRERETAMTDADGRFELRQLQPGRLYVCARHPSFASSDWREFELGAGERLSEVELRVRTGALLTGRVLDSTGAPMANRWVVCHAVESWDPVRVRTDVEGRFHAEALVPGEWQVIALGLEDDDPGMVSVSDLQMAHVQLEDGGTHHVDLGGEASTGALIEGRATFAPTGRNNWVQARADDRAGLFLARIQDDGSFQTTVPQTGRYLLSILVDKTFDRGNELYVTTAVDKEPSQPIEIPSPGGRLVGRIVDAQGRGVAGVPLRLENLGRLIPGTQIATRFVVEVSGDDGRFVIEHLPTGVYRVTAGGLPYVEAAAPKARWSAAVANDVEVVAGSEREDLVLSIDEPRSVEGHVVDQSGRPIEGATIFARLASGSLVHELALVRSDAQGRFGYDGLPSEPVAFTAKAPGWASRTHALDADGEVRITTVQSGHLVVEHNCVSGGTLSLRDENGLELAGREDFRDAAREQGLRWHASRVEFQDLAPGRYTVELRPFGSPAQIKYVQVEAGLERRVVFTSR